MVDIKGILTEAVEKEASDVHINVGLRPIIRVNTELVETDFPTITDEDAREILISLIGQDKFNIFDERRDFDFSTSITDPDQRFRVNAHYQRDTIAISFRLISDRVPTIEELNLPEKVKEFAELPRGLVLVTGHTGAGKSTTLASTIGLINTKYRKRIITIEDPIEYWLLNDMCMIEQREVGSDCPDFATGLRHILRQDPDIIMVGEMRDLETTSFTLTAAETGHLVFSTLHTNDAPSAITRLLDMGVKPFLVASSIQAIMAQRLVRVICKECKVVNESPNPRFLRLLNISQDQIKSRPIYKGAGCPRCNNTGFKGRIAIFEMMHMNNEIRELAFKRATATELRKAARAAGMRNLLEDGKLKIFNGITTPEEVARYAQEEGFIIE